MWAFVGDAENAEVANTKKRYYGKLIFDQSLIKNVSYYTGLN